MVIYCVAYGCKNLQSKGNNIKFHSFPHKKPDLLNKLINTVKRENWKPTKYSKLCSDHFTSENYLDRRISNIALLKPDAVPSVINFPKYLTKVNKKPRRIIVKATASSTSFVHSENEHTEPEILDMDVDLNVNSKVTQCSPQKGDTPRKRKLRQKIKVLNQRLRRRNTKTKTMKQLIRGLVDFGYKLNSVFEFRAEKRALNKDQGDDDQHLLELFDAINNSINLSDLQENILYYISGYIVRKLLNKLNCIDCKNIILRAANDTEHNYNMTYKYSKFVNFVTRGGLLYASDIVFKIICFCEKQFKLQCVEQKLRNNIQYRIITCAVRNFMNKLDLFQPKHPISEELLSEYLHEVQIIKQIAIYYTEMRITTSAKKVTERMQGFKATLRHKLTKTI